MLKDWVEVELGEIASKITDGSHNPPKKQEVGLPMLSATNILDDKIVFDNYRLIDPVEFESECKRANVEPEDILLTIVGTIGRSAVVPHNIKKFTLQRSVALIKLEGLNSKYISFALRSPSIQSFFKEQSKGTAQRGIYLNTLKKIVIPLAPLPEQRAIAAKIEQLFSELDNGIANLKTAKSKLEIYRQAILKQAFEGELTKDWRKKQPKNHGNHVNQKNHSTDNLPETWKWLKLEDLAIVGTGATPKRGDSNYWLNGSIAWITSGALNDLYVKEASEFITEAAIKETNCKIFPKGSLLIAMYGEGKTRGKCSELMISAATNQAIASIEINDEFKEYKKYIKWFLLKNYDDIRMLSSGGVQPNLNLTIVKNTKLPFCPIEEQTQIVQEIETRLSVCDKLNEAIEQSLEKAQALRQSILKKAFEGKLLSQDELETCRQQPDWEPAAKLLERVKNKKNK